MPLQPDQVLMMILLLVSRFSLQRWTDRVDLRGSEVRESTDRTNFITISRAPTRGDLLQPSHLILAFHQAAFQMASQPNGFRGLRARLTLRGKPIGLIVMTNERPYRQLINAMSDSAELNTIPSTPRPIVSDLGADSGELSIPNAPNVRIVWEFDPRRIEIDELEVWTAMIDAFTTIGPHDMDEVCNDITSHSVKGTVVLVVTRKANQRRLTYGIVALALIQIISLVLAGERRFEELNFQFVYQGVDFGIASLFRRIGGRGVVVTQAISAS